MAAAGSAWWPRIWAESYRSGTSPQFDHTIRVADPFHAVRIRNRCIDKVLRRVQNESLGHPGRKD